MNVNELRVKVQQAEDGYDILHLDTDYEGSCPCFWVHGEDFDIHGHCWRPNCKKHDYVGLHANVPADIGRLMARHLTGLDWYGEWSWTPDMAQ